MKKLNLSHLFRLMKDSFSGLLAAAATALLLLLVRRDIVGEGVIALVLLLPVVWSAYRRGPGAGMGAALAAALCFDFLFLPPFYTFTIGSVEGWLIFVIFFVVAIIVVERIQSTLSRARASEQEAVMMYELSMLLSGLRSQDAIARSVARFLRQRYLTALVSVFIHPGGQAGQAIAHEPQDALPATSPDCILPLINSWGLAGEIQIWRSDDVGLPSAESRLFRNIALQVGLAVERVQITEYELEQAAAQKNKTR
jgi:two-component system sensor histidine kinase KdpD